MEQMQKPQVNEKREISIIHDDIVQSDKSQEHQVSNLYLVVCS